MKMTKILSNGNLELVGIIPTQCYKKSLSAIPLLALWPRK